MTTTPLPLPALWHDQTTGQWKVLTKPDRPTYEAYYTAEQVHAARADLEAEVQRLRAALESARGSLAGAISKVRENPNLAESTCRHGMHGIDAALKETP